MTIRVMTVFGTRPEAIKMAPVVLGLEQDKDIESVVCVTAQHREMLDQVLDIFDIKPDYDLNLMKQEQTLDDVTAGVLLGMKDVLEECKPDVVFVHGDTTTCFSAALAAFYQKIPVGHVEAGLRTGDMHAPFPEEANRALAGRITRFHFAPTETAKNNLLKENTPEGHITVTGNTVIDALLIVRDKVKQIDIQVWKEAFGPELVEKIENKERKMILITGHRRENFGQGFIDLCEAIKTLAASHPSWDFIYPVHLNPNVQKPVKDILKFLNNVALIEPVEYSSFVWLLDNCDLVLTDSGGVQEEAPSMGKPVLVMREVTERPEAVEAGTVKLVGTDKEKIVSEVEKLLLEGDTYTSMAKAINPYGDGKSTPRIIEFVKSNLRAYAISQSRKTAKNTRF
ncbi:MAG TPA: UDP-N-acetylglucosamine 2-epimerase (non-hydrolyzing) [Gammaproteobacteria bacterium]|nr:UDP-N-acetylglucosamine 2-epimerase (non-hydrolyzing) [Gammaproteobacteria bacterium]